MRLTKLVVALASLVSITAFATEINRSEVSEKFQSLTPFKVLTVENSPTDSMYQVITTQGIFYMTKDGEYIFSGALHGASAGLPNLTDARIAQMASAELKSLKDSFITMKAPNEKHEVIVFYDTTCPFCHRIQQEIDSYLNAGITVHYAGYPREGLQDRRSPGTGAFPNPSFGYQELLGVWCSSNPAKSLEDNAKGARIPTSACRNKIAEHYAIGQLLGVQGTPAIYSFDGKEVAAGYVPAQALLSTLESASR